MLQRLYVHGIFHCALIVDIKARSYYGSGTFAFGKADVRSQLTPTCADTPQNEQQTAKNSHNDLSGYNGSLAVSVDCGTIIALLFKAF